MHMHPHVIATIVRPYKYSSSYFLMISNLLIGGLPCVFQGLLFMFVGVAVDTLWQFTETLLYAMQCNTSSIVQ